jgi:hypothetical protein
LIKSFYRPCDPFGSPALIAEAPPALCVWKLPVPQPFAEQGNHREDALGKVPAANFGSGASASEDADFSSPSGPSAFQRELDRARRHLAKLEAEDRLRRQHPVILEEHAGFDESPTFVRICNLLIWAIVLLPVALAVLALVRRVAG